MTDPTTTDGSLQGTLTAHYRGEIARLQQQPGVSDTVQAELARLDAAFAVGFDDALCDRFETVVRTVASASGLRYLSNTPTGDALAAAAAERLVRDERVVTRLTAQLRAERPDRRRDVAAALREALSSHRNSWQLAAEKLAAPAGALRPATALLDGLEAGVNSVISTTQAESQPTAQRAPDTRIDVQRLLARLGGPAQSVPDDVRAELVLDEVGEDGAVRELLRARLDQARAAAPAAPTVPRLATVDRELASAARALGAAWTGAALRAAPPDTGAKAADVVRLRTLQADIYRQRVQASNARGAARLAMERRHETLVADAQAARTRAERDDKFSAEETAAARSGVRAELSAAGGAGLPGDVLAALRRAADEAAAVHAPLPQAPGVAEAEAALRDALANGIPGSVDLQAEVTAGAEQQQRAALGILARRLLQRQNTTSFASLPEFGASRVYAADRGAMDPLDDVDPSMWGSVEDRRKARDAREPAQAAPPRIAALGRAIAGSLERLMGPVRPAPRPQSQPDATAQVMPRMAARMPSNIFADTSSMRMQSLYMPVLARMIGRPTPMLARPRARRKDNTGTLLNSVATPEGLYSLLLGELGQRLYDEKPEVAERLEASLKRAAAALPNAGDQALPVLQRHTEQFRTTVETWLGSGSSDGVERGRTEEVLAAGQGAARTVGDYVGGMFAIDAHGAGASEIDLLQDRADQVEQQLRSERTFVDQSLLDRVSGMVGRGPTRAVEAYQGPTSQAIAQEMGAEAFTVENKMFFPHAVPESIKAHEMVHAIDASSDAHPRTIEDEERRAYGVQGQVEQGRKAIDMELNNAVERMDLAKEENIPPARLTTDPGGVAGTEDPDPGVRTSNPKDQMFKEEQLLEAITDAVESMLVFEDDIDRERYGRT